MGDVAITHKAGTKDYRVRGVVAARRQLREGFFLREVHLAMYTVRIAVPHAFSELVVNGKATESRRLADNSPRLGAYAHSSTA